MRSLSRFVSVSLALCGPLLAQGALAQNVGAFRELFDDRLHQQGDSFVLCYDANSVMAEFDKSLATAIGEALLTEVKTVPIESLPPHRKLDTSLHFSQDQLYILMAQQCDGVMGFVLAPGYEAWLAISRPYLITDSLLVTKKDGVTKLDDVDKSLPVGSRVGSDGDASLLAYNQALPETTRWKRFAYYDNDLLFTRLTDGTLGAGVIWEPILDVAANGDPASVGLHTIQAPFTIGKTQVGIAVRSNDAYLRSELDEATKALVADGTIDQLLAQYHLSGPTTVPQTQQNPQ